MIIAQGRAIDPMKSVDLSLLNEGYFLKNSYIAFRVGKSDANVWLIDDSYLSFDLELAKDTVLNHNAAKAVSEGASVPLPNIYIRMPAMCLIKWR